MISLLLRKRGDNTVNMLACACVYKYDSRQIEKKNLAIIKCLKKQRFNFSLKVHKILVFTLETCSPRNTKVTLSE